MFLPHPRVKVSIVGSLRDREVACSASDRQVSNFEFCVWRTVSSQSSHHPQEVLLAQFSLYVHKGGLKPDSFHFTAQQTQDVASMLDQPWFTVHDVGPTLNQHWFNILCLLGWIMALHPSKIILRCDYSPELGSPRFVKWYGALTWIKSLNQEIKVNMVKYASYEFSDWVWRGWVQFKCAWVHSQRERMV